MKLLLVPRHKQYTVVHALRVRILHVLYLLGEALGAERTPVSFVPLVSVPFIEVIPKPATSGHVSSLFSRMRR